jgi:hypothetical protein
LKTPPVWTISRQPVGDHHPTALWRNHGAALLRPDMVRGQEASNSEKAGITAHALDQ